MRTANCYQNSGFFFIVEGCGGDAAVCIMITFPNLTLSKLVYVTGSHQGERVPLIHLWKVSKGKYSEIEV